MISPFKIFISLPNFGEADLFMIRDRFLALLVDDDRASAERGYRNSPVHGADWILADGSQTTFVEVAIILLPLPPQ